MNDDAHRMVTVAEAGSISKAARQLHVSQPALSNWLKKLEGNYGTALFDRGSSPLIPTYAGETYLRWARETTRSEAAMEEEMTAIAGDMRRRLRVGTSVPRGSGILPDVLERFRQECSECTVVISEAGTPDSHNQKLLAGEIDCAVLTSVAPEAPLFTGKRICSERMVVAMPASWETEGFIGGPDPRPIDLSIFRSMPFIMPPSHLKHYSVVKSLMDAAGVRPNVVFRSCSNEMTIELVKRGQGASMMPNTFVFPLADERISLYDLGELVRPTYLYCNRRIGSAVGEDEALFIRLLREWVDAHPAFGVDRCGS